MASKPSIEALRQQIRALESGGAEGLKGAVAAETSAEPGFLSKDVTPQNKSGSASRRRKKSKRPLPSPGRKSAARRVEESGSGWVEDGALKMTRS